MQNNQNDFERQYSQLLKIPLSILLIVLFLVVLIIDNDVIKNFLRNNGAIWIFVIGSAILMIDFVARKIIKSYCMAQNFTPAQLTQVNQLAKYLAYSSVICLVVTIIMLNYIIKSI